MRIFTFSFGKDGNYNEENEDFVGHSFNKKSETHRFAVADGASTGIYSGIWAKILVQTYTKTQKKSDFKRFLTKSNTKWANFLYSVLNEDSDKNYTEAFVTKLQNGSFSTFLGLTFFKKNKWSAVAVGDTCLFQIRAGKIKEKFPVECADAFSNTPYMIPTLNKIKEKSISGIISKSQKGWSKGDIFILASDALSEWFLSEYEKDREPWQEILVHCSDESMFKFWISSLKMKKSLKNDDISCILIKCD